MSVIALKYVFAALIALLLLLTATWLAAELRDWRRVVRKLRRRS